MRVVCEMLSQNYMTLILNDGELLYVNLPFNKICKLPIKDM
jgi:hypothetical protein